MDAIRQTFFQECEEQLAELETGLLAMEAGACDSETVNAVFRAVHSVKGGAGAFGLEALVRFAHVFETALDAVRAGRLAPQTPVVKAMLRAADILADLVGAGRDGRSLAGGHADESVHELQALGGPPPASEAEDAFAAFSFSPVAATFDAPPPSWTVWFRPHPAMYAKANEAGALLRELARLGEADITLDDHALPELAALDPEGAYLAWTVTLRTDASQAAISDVFEFVEGDCDVSITASAEPEISDSAAVDVAALLATLETEPTPPQAALPPPREAAPAPTIRVDLDRVDRLINLVGELVINGAMLTQRVTEAGLARSSGITAALEEQEGLTREIQDSVMAIRAQPVKSVFARMSRVAREVAAMTGKQVRLMTEGEATEVDKTVIEHLADPLTHMIRNAIDHGLETPQTRRSLGKPEEGVVRLQALHRSGRIVIEVSDDGAGIDRARVRASAVAKGLLPADAALSDEEIDNLIFLPGFSTAAALSDISGRGVGMDVVRRSIQALGGRIVIASRPGHGSTFTMSLPLTLAVLDGMVVSVAGHTLVVPLTAIVETLQPRAADCQDVGDGARVIGLRGRYLPLIDVGAALGWAGGTGVSAVALLVEGEDGARAVLQVDAIGGQRQVVIKSLEANYRPVPGVAAATILGDGRVALILDVDSIVSAARNEGRAARAEEGLAYA